MRAYRAIAFDLCNTLFHIRAERFPLIRLGDRMVRSTAPRLYPLLKEVAPHIEEHVFTTTYHRVSEELDEQKRREGREIPAGIRYYRTLQALGFGEENTMTSLLLRLAEAHAASLLEAMDCPSSHHQLIGSLQGQYRLALVTNFDHPETVRRLLKREGIAHRFDAVIISGEIGWRKPRAEVFQAALSGLDVAPAGCLFVGDDYERDVRGAASVGMPVVWLNEHDEPLPVEGPFPLATIRALPELTSILHAPPL